MSWGRSFPSCSFQWMFYLFPENVDLYFLVSDLLKYIKRYKWHKKKGPHQVSHMQNKNHKCLPGVILGEKFTTNMSLCG